MVELLANPSGDETQKESITLQNNGAAEVSLAGWAVKDAAGKTGRFLERYFLDRRKLFLEMASQWV